MNKPQAPSDKRQLIADGLLRGLPLAEIRTEMVAHGVSAPAADYEVRRAEKDPVIAAAATLARRVQKRDWLLTSLGRLAGGLSGEVEVPVLERIGANEFFDQYYFRNQPVLLTGMVEDWPARSRWSLDYFEKTCGDAEVELQVDRERAVDYEVAKDRHRARALLRDVIASIRLGPSNDFYVTAYNGGHNQAVLARLWEDVGSFPFLSLEHGGGWFLWLGPQGTLTPFHHDLTNNLLVQLVGRKRVRLVPSWALPQMRNGLHCFSELELQEFDEPGAPPCSTIDLEPGQALFLPVGWWHHVEALDPSASVSFTNFARPNDFVAGYPADGRF